ncbi:hypothetical protein BJY01DRAFT_83948 [Aspergillus pseudoustus]|uniref:DUF3824 domain-containing protein n=1 Tax=Aspergillus pseudoustus TaxID=1810923 RepID=A0ABR4J3B3_9EURO
MAYYDSRPPYPPHQERYPPAEYPETPYYHGSHQPTDAVAPAAATSGTRDSYYRNHPARDAYEYGYDDPHHSSRRSRKKSHRTHSADGYYDDPYESYEPRSRRSRQYDERHGREKYAYSPSSSRSPPRRRRSLSERALGALGLGGATAAAAGSKHHDSGRGRSRGRDHRRSYSYSPSPTRGSHQRGKSEARIAQAVKAALTAGAVEAFRARKEPGDWSGAKGKRVLTAAIAAGGTDGLVDRNPDKHSKRHILESTLAGLATNRVVNGSRSRSRSRKRSRSHGRSKAKDAALMGLLATAGKEAYDRYQKSQSRPRDRRRSTSRDSYDDDYDSRHRGSKKRSKSVSDYINDGMAALGLGDKSEKGDKDDRRRRHREHRSSRYDNYSDDDRYSDDDYYRRHPSPPRTRHSRDVSGPRYIAASGARSDEGYGHMDVGSYSQRPDFRRNSEQPRDRKQNGSDADDSIDEHKRLKKLNRETLWATGIAAAATIHAAHSLTENMEKHKERTKQLKDGEITPEEARSRRRKNQLSDLASVGVAALGIQSAVGEWKNFDQKRRERQKCHKDYKEYKQRAKSMSGQGQGHHSRSQSRPHRTQSLDYGHPPPGRTVYPDEIEENWSDARPRSVKSPGLMV